VGGAPEADKQVWHTIDTRAVEDLAGLAGWTCAIALDLENPYVSNQIGAAGQESGTFRLRQLLQFMASRGSFETRRAGRRSIPI
jgi:hypothetical protein